MITYSVTVAVDRDTATDWFTWMCDEHIPDVMNTGYFTNSRIRRALDATDDARVTYNIEYTCESLGQLSSYQAEHAVRLQQEHTQRYEGRFSATRAVYEDID